MNTAHRAMNRYLADALMHGMGGIASLLAVVLFILLGEGSAFDVAFKYGGLFIALAGASYFFAQMIRYFICFQRGAK